MLIDLSQLKSLRELSQEESKHVFERYKKGNAAGVDTQGTVFLQQQRSVGALVDQTLQLSEIRLLCEERKIKWDDRYEKRTKTYVASDETVDSYGDIIKQNGWDLKRFKTNPVGMWVHDYSQLPISSGIKAWVDNAKLMIVHLFALSETYPWADTVFKMVDAGFLKGNSVGFIPRKIMQVDDEDERKKLGLGKFGVVFVKQELLEDSICPIGANPAALVQNSLIQAAQKGIITKSELELIQKNDNPQTRSPEGIRELCNKVLTIISETTRSIPAEGKKVIPFKHHSLADEDAEWDGPKQVAAAEVKDLKVMCTWYDSENSDIKSSYKLPHHQADGYKTVWRGVAAAMGALLGARGGVDIPDNDKKGCYNHLSRHYREFDKEPPEFKAYTEAELREIFKGLIEFPEPPKEEKDFQAQIERVLDAVSALDKEVNAISLKLIDIENNLALVKTTLETDAGGSGGSRSPEPESKHYVDELFNEAKGISQTLGKKGEKTHE